MVKRPEMTKRFGEKILFWPLATTLVPSLPQTEFKPVLGTVQTKKCCLYAKFHLSTNKLVISMCMYIVFAFWVPFGYIFLFQTKF